MSDTKALQDVVAKALANWGNSEAQEAFEALVGRLNDAEEARDHAVDMIRSARHTFDALASLHEIGDHAYQELACHLKDEPNGHEGERITTRAEADNAALLKALNTVGHALGTAEMDAALDVLLANARKPHPGAALLEELEGLRKRVEFLSEREKHIAKVLDVADGGQYRNDWDGAVARMKDSTHNAALEEAEGSLFHLGFSEDAMGRETLHRAMGRIRALKKTGQGA